ncbi:MAG: hypothetical protein JW787_04825 [Sedimentisphaerales bacterium]|nr:hypothetical protein [Sedimentisphaerales bacterium]
MVNVRKYFLYTRISLLIVMLSAGQVLMAAEASGTTATTSKPSIAAAKETESSTVEDGGSGAYKAIKVNDSSLATHTIYRPKDLSVFGEKDKLPILAWGNGGCSNSNTMHENYLSEIASHGFLVAAIGPYQAGGQRGGRGGGMMGGMGAPGGIPGGPMGAIAGGTPEGTRGGAAGGMPGGMRGGAAGGARGAGGGMGSSTQSSQLLDAVNWAIAQNSDKASIYYNKIDISKIGVAGHSCGGLQALEVSTDTRITTTLVVDSGILNTGGGAPGGRGGMPGAAPGGMPGGPMGAMQGDAAGGARRGARGGMPGGATGGARGGAGGMMGMPALTKDHLAKLHGPVLYLLGGESDIAYANGMDDFKHIEKIPVFVANQGVGHGGTFTQPHGGDWATVSSAWLKWQLKGDKEAGKMFTGNPCGLVQDKKWTVDKKNIP